MFKLFQPDALFHSLLNTCCTVLIQTRYVTVVNYTVIKVCCLDLAQLCQQESFFLFLIRPKRLWVISCGENANTSDAVGLGLQPLSLLPRGCVCMRTVRGRIFPLSCGPCMLENCVDLLWSGQQNIIGSNVRITACSPCCSQGCSVLPHTLTDEKRIWVRCKQPNVFVYVCVLFCGRVFYEFHWLIPLRWRVAITSTLSLVNVPFNLPFWVLHCSDFLPTECICPAVTGLSQRQLHSGDASQTGREGEEPDWGRHRERTRGVQRSTEGQSLENSNRLLDKLSRKEALPPALQSSFICLMFPGSVPQ